MPRPNHSFKHILVFLVLLLFLAIGLIQKHLERIQVSYQIGEMKKKKTLLQKEKKKLEALMATATTPELLLRKSKLLGLPFVPQTKAKARPAEGVFHGQ